MAATEKGERRLGRTLEVASRSHTSRWPRMWNRTSFGRSNSRVCELHRGTEVLIPKAFCSSVWACDPERVSPVVMGQDAGVRAVSEPVTKTSSRHSSIVVACGWAWGLGELAVPAGVGVGGSMPSASFPRPEIESLLVLAMNWTATAKSRSSPFPPIPWSLSGCWPSRCSVCMGNDAMGDGLGSGGAAIFSRWRISLRCLPVSDDLATTRLSDTTITGTCVYHLRGAPLCCHCLQSNTGGASQAGTKPRGRATSSPSRWAVCFPVARVYIQPL
jgi:hypothetical protein